MRLPNLDMRARVVSIIRWHCSKHLPYTQAQAAQLHHRHTSKTKLLLSLSLAHAQQNTHSLIQPVRIHHKENFQILFFFIKRINNNIFSAAIFDSVISTVCVCMCSVFRVGEIYSLWVNGRIEWKTTTTNVDCNTDGIGHGIFILHSLC